MNFLLITIWSEFWLEEIIWTLEKSSNPNFWIKPQNPFKSVEKSWTSISLLTYNYHTAFLWNYFFNHFGIFQFQLFDMFRIVITCFPVWHMYSIPNLEFQNFSPRTICKVNYEMQIITNIWISRRVQNKATSYVLLLKTTI